MKNPINYEGWKMTSGSRDSLGIQMVIALKVLGRIKELEMVIGERIGKSFARKLTEMGYKSNKGNILLEYDASLAGYEITTILDTEQGDTPNEYLGMAFNMWQQEYSNRIMWENKSLGQYIKYWFRRKLKR